MKGFKALVTISALAMIGGVVLDAWAGCSPARLFRSQGKPNNTQNVRWSTVGTDQGDNEIGRLWDLNCGLGLCLFIVATHFF